MHKKMKIEKDILVNNLLILILYIESLKHLSQK